MLQDVKPENTFWLKNGKGIKNIAELGRELKQMKDEVFSHHVNDSKNDFANWTEFCLQDQKLAVLLRTTKNRERMAAITERRIQELTVSNIRPPTKISQKPQKRELQPITYQPTIIRTKNVTPLSFKPDAVQTENAHKPEIINTPHKTQLYLGKSEIYIHEVKTHHYSAIQLTSYVAFGIIVGAALTILMYAR